MLPTSHSEAKMTSSAPFRATDEHTSAGFKLIEGRSHVVWIKSSLLFKTGRKVVLMDMPSFCCMN